MRIRWHWLYIFLAIGTAAFFFYKQYQQPLSYEFASQFDGNDYTNSYQYFSGILNNYEVAFPFNGRILVPWLAAQINSGDIIADLQWINLAFTLAAIIVL
ncbi:MAG: hypothetical protein ACI9Z3_001794, partial [Roseivirga sp.]